jgi:hypothetical protein
MHHSPAPLLILLDNKFSRKLRYKGRAAHVLPRTHIRPRSIKRNILMFYQTEPMDGGHAVHRSGNYHKFGVMKNVAIGFLTALLCAAPSGHAQQIADVPTKNNGAMLSTVEVARDTFTPEQPTGVPQHTISCASGTSVAPTGYVCSSGLGIIKQKKGPVTQSLLQVDSSSDSSACGALFSTGYLLESNNVEPDAYDTLRLFMEQCPLYPTSVEGFGLVNAAVSGWSAGGTGRWQDYLTWLKSILYLNTDTSWYCEDVSAMITALQNDQAAKMAAIGYVIQSGKCPGFDTVLYNTASRARHTAWLDSVEMRYKYVDVPPTNAGYINMLDSINADTLAHPYDTTVPTLFQDSLQILLGPQYASSVGARSPITSQALLSAQLLENPIDNEEIDISYQMGRSALVTMELNDVLGRSVPIANAKYQLEQPGSHNATIPAPNLPAGTYYLRITTDAGDAITLKMVKE